MKKKKTIDYLKDFWRDIVNIEGRITGKDFFITYLLLTLVSIVLFVSVIGMVLLPIFWLICLVGIFTMAIRRLNDIGKSRWLIILLFIPFLVNIIFLIYLCCKPSKIVTENENKKVKQYIKVSNKILNKATIMTIILFLMIYFIAIINAIIMYYNVYESNQRNAFDEENIQYFYKRNYTGKDKIFYYKGDFVDINADGDVSYEEFKIVYQNHHLTSAQNSLKYYKILLSIGIGYVIFFIVVLICSLRYLKKLDAILKYTKKYRNYMLATNSYKIEDIAKEFGEEASLVEARIQKAINKHILKNVYLSKQTKEILLVNKTPSTQSIKGNQQNVNVENNVIINDNTTKQ